MNLKQLRAALVKEAQDLLAKAKSEGREYPSEDEAARLKAIETEVADLDTKIKAAADSAALIASLTINEPEPVEGMKSNFEGGSIGERFVKSEAFRGFRKAHPAGVGSGTPIHVEAKGVGDLADLGMGAKATIDSAVGQQTPLRLPGYRSMLIDEPITFLDLVTTGTTEASWIEYAQIVSETDNAAIVPEGELKPLSDVTTAKAEAKAHTYADGFDVTNQTLADDGALVAFMDSRIRWHVRNKVEDVLLNGDTTANVKGILNTTGVQAQAAVGTDPIATIAAALGKVEAVQVTPQAIVMNPADAWKLSLLKESGVGYLMGNPLQQSLNPSPFGVRLVKSNRVTAGTFLVGNFSSVQLLIREALNVMVFNQHKDYAQRNMSYVRAELRALQLFYSPRDVVVGTLPA